MKKRFVAFFTALVLAVASLATFATAAPADVLAKVSSDSNSIVIFHLNDSHSRVDGTETNIGFAKYAELIKEAKAINPNVLVVDAGDTFHGQIFANLEKGESIVRLLNEMDVDVMTAGNHDFNYGYDQLLSLASNLNFPLISANVDYDNGESLFDSYIIKEVAGKKVGIFGLTTPETAYKTHPDNVVGIQFIDPIEAAEEAVAALKADGADIIVALGHIGLDEGTEVTSEDIVEAVDGIDLFIDGHSHTVLKNGMEVGNSLIVSTGEYDNNVGIVTLELGENGIESKKAELISAADMADFPQDEKVAALIAEVNDAQKEMMNEVIGETTVDLEGTRELVRAGETNLGNLVVDAILAETGADAVLSNGGNVRASIPAGPITKGDIITVLPFGNIVLTIKITGQEFKDALENGVKIYPEPSGAFPHIAGATFTLDPNKPAGQRVVDLEIGGVPVDLNKEYVIATNDFLAAGGDEYASLANGTIVNIFGSYEEIIMSYIAEAGTISPVTDGRITFLEVLEVIDEIIPGEEEPVEEVVVEEEPEEDSVILPAPIDTPERAYYPIFNKGYYSHYSYSID